MMNRNAVRWLVPVFSAFAGVCCAAAFTSSCSLGTDCECSEPRPIALGEFDNVHAVVSEGAPASLRDIDVTRLVIADGTVVVDFARGGEAGTATFTFSNMY